MKNANLRLVIGIVLSLILAMFFGRWTAKQEYVTQINRINELQEFVKNNKVSAEPAKADVPNINVTRTTSTNSKPDVDVEKLTEYRDKMSELMEEEDQL